MRPHSLLRSGQRLSRAMSRCVLEPRPPGKRWMVSGVGRPHTGSRTLTSVRPLLPPNCCPVFLTGLAWICHHHHHHHHWLSPHGASWEPGSASCLHRHYRREQRSCGKRPRMDSTQAPHDWIGGICKDGALQCLR
uniref:Peptidyl-tRNA hydrolase 1 homolog n=1 Tax=Saimiri boliviensis boliviensis TaxID=39432 RepID=A0A2K6TKN1_SAIBB